MGMAMGQDSELMGEVCGWINKAATKPVWAKMTPNVTDITDPARAALEQVGSTELSPCLLSV
jgi:dihydropyrimidine dehydrogenase (NADP+)